MKDEGLSSKKLGPFVLLSILIALIAANVFIYKGILAPHAAEADVLAVGKAEAILLRTRNGAIILVDTGPDASILRLLGAVLPPWRRSIGAVILTSGKAAQAGGLSSIRSRYDVGAVLRVGTVDLPYGTTFTASDLSFAIVAPSNIGLSIGSTMFTISSSTLPGTYPL